MLQSAGTQGRSVNDHSLFEQIHEIWRVGYGHFLPMSLDITGLMGFLYFRENDT